MEPHSDTIAAIATPAGRGGVGIVRISGPAVPAIAAGLAGGLPRPRQAAYRTFRDSAGNPIDTGLLLYFPAPRSFTGEDVLECHGHGGTMVLDQLLHRVLALGARPARPGEFTQRAFLNDKLDLAQAEAVADIIEAGSAQAVRAAMRSLEGEFSRRVHGLVEGLIRLRVQVEAAIDFTDEDIDPWSRDLRVESLQESKDALDALLAQSRQSRLLSEGMTVVIAGRPNAGKSSLMNALAGAERAIVTVVPGTTRDVLREQVHIDGMPVHVFDTAGLRDSADLVEREGIARAWRQIETADRVLLVIDDTQGPTPEDEGIRSRLPPGVPCTRLYNKIDLTGASAGYRDSDDIALSAKTGAGVDVLRDHLKAAMGFDEGAAGDFLARRRHLHALDRAGEHLDQAIAVATAQGGLDLLAEELRLCQAALGEITGEVHSDDLLGEIFSTFCIGK